MGFIELNRRLGELQSGLLATFIAEILNSDIDLLEELQKDQLYAGQNADGNSLTPSYYADPFFKNPISAAKYAAYKEKLNVRLHNPIFKKKDFETPNLIVTGTLVYDTIFAKVNGVSSFTIDANSPIYGKLMSKYKDPFGLNKVAWDWYTENYLVPELKDKIGKYLEQ